MSLIKLYRRLKLHKRSGDGLAKSIFAMADACVFKEDYDAWQKTARRLQNCAYCCKVALVTPPGDATRLVISNRGSCKIVWCPVCQGFRSYKRYKLLSSALDLIWADTPSMRVIVLTTSTRNRPLTVADTKAMIADQKTAHGRLCRSRRVQRATEGHFGTIELPIRGTDEAPEIGVHGHTMFLVRSVEPGHPSYIPYAEWRTMWAKACRITDYQPQVWIKAARGPDGETDPDSIMGAVRECTKYLVKPSIFVHEDGQIRVDPRVIRVLAASLHGQQFTTADRLFAASIRRARANFKASRPSGRHTPADDYGTPWADLPTNLNL